MPRDDDVGRLLEAPTPSYERAGTAVPGYLEGSMFDNMDDDTPEIVS